MGYYNILKYFIRRLFSFLRSITGKLFVIFILLFCVLILYMCIDKGVFAIGSYNIDTSSFSSSTLDYIDECTEVVKTYCNNNNIDMSIFNHITILVMTNEYSSMENTNQHFIIALTRNMNLSWSSHNGTWRYVGSPYEIYMFDFRTFGTNITGSFHRYNNGDYFLSNVRVLFSNYSQGTDIVENWNDGFFDGSVGLDVDPFIENESSTIENWSFDYLNINSGSVGYVYYDDLLDTTSYSDLNLKYTYDGITYTQSIPSGYLVDWSDDNFTLEIPRTWLLSNVNIQNGKTVAFYLEVKKQNVSDNIYYLGSYTLSLTTTEQEQIQQDNDKALQGQILESQQQTNNKLDNIDNTINNSNVDDITSDTLPSDSTTDITANGVNGIFTSIYNAFCVGNAQDIVFPIPFTDKSITLSANYLSNSLTNANATFVITIIQAFWWYIISRFIIKDIMNKINKIKSGNIEDIETTNIRGDML